MKKIACFGLTVFLSLLSLTVIPVSATEEIAEFGETLPDEYLTFLERLPDEICRFLPEDLFSEDPVKVSEALEEMSHISYLLEITLSLVGIHLSDCIALFLQLTGLLLLGAVFHSMRSAFLQDSISTACTFCIRLILLILLVGIGYQTLSEVTEYLNRLNRFTEALIPLTGALYAMGGNVSTAVASSAGLSVCMTLSGQAVGNTVIPFCGLCLAFCTVSALNPELRIHTLLNTIKRNYTLFLTFLMMLLLAMLSMQNTIASRADTLAMKSARFAVGNLIPVVGGSVSELLRSVGTGISYLRGTVGICAVLLLLLLLLPTLIRLLLFRLTWQLGASLADLLGCGSEKTFMEEFASLCGYLIAAVSICSSTVLLSVTLLIHCASAIG